MKDMEIARAMSVGNRVSLPAQVVELFGIKPGNGVIFVVKDNKVSLLPAEITAKEMPAQEG